ncbi:MAG: sensor histidine kinase [Synergistaceae bacterium]|nr:sensor histidine kinase [Synergistaceae bacterium]NCB71839.1 sensor histidine kinase [Clostridia bacterium]PKL04526.1 MAG: sensor histidine kinase [Synergistetes bacterium HGW-Synergistetes-1]MBP9559543.1 sensor histidine kinase [Synergistaceae bacterium]MBP9975531.1 sensor histidine kinase [Synergistaceae bacterium]
MRRNLLLQLTVAVFLPSLGAFLLAWIGFCQFENTMEGVAGSYVQNLARGAAARLESSQWDLRTDGTWQPNQYRSRILGLGEMMSDEMAVPGMFAVFDSDGNLIYGTSDVTILSIIWNKPIATMSPQKIRGPDGRFYTIAVYPMLQRNLFVLAAVSWDKLLGPMVSLTTFWPFIMGILGLIGIFSVYIMWQKVIMPLKDLEEEVSMLSWGEEVPLKNAPEAVTELQKLREALVVLANSAIDKVQLSRRYVNDLVKVQEEERARISREIHDGPLQDLTALIQRLRLLSLDIDSPVEREKQLEEAKSAAMAGVKEMRELCNNLTPPWLDLGIVQALTELSERQSAQLNIKIHLDLQEIPDLSDEATLAFFRVAQEAVNNSARHADAENVSISLKNTGKMILLQIEDDGKGFEVLDNFTELRVQGHRGLSNMRERMSIVGGHFSIFSTPGKGTVIRCELPLVTVQ